MHQKNGTFTSKNKSGFPGILPAKMFVRRFLLEFLRCAFDFLTKKKLRKYIFNSESFLPLKKGFYPLFQKFSRILCPYFRYSNLTPMVILKEFESCCESNLNVGTNDIAIFVFDLVKPCHFKRTCIYKCFAVFMLRDTTERPHILS